MKSRIVTSLIALLLAAAPMEATASPARVWEHMELTAADNDSPLGVEVAVRDGYVYVTLSRRAQVRLLTRLGRAVPQTERTAGTSRPRMNSRGGYILKARGTPCRSQH